MTRALWLIISCLLLNDKLKSKTAIGKTYKWKQTFYQYRSQWEGQGAARRRKIEGNRNDEKMKKNERREKGEEEKGRGKRRGE